MGVGNLVLSRKVGQSILIGDSIVITITEITNTKAKVSIKAPKQMRILRSEIMPSDASCLTQNELEARQTL